MAAFAVIMLTRNLLVTSADSVDRMNRTIKALADGKMDMTLRADAVRESGEVGVLENGLAALAVTHHNFMLDLDKAVLRMQSGEDGVTLDIKNLSGGLRDMAVHINTVASEGEKNRTVLINAIEAFARGDFAPLMVTAHPKAAEAVKKLSQQATALKNDALAVASAAKEGRLNIRTTGNYNGEWAHIASDINAAPDAVLKSVNEILSALERFEGANFSSGLGSYLTGDFVKVKDALERAGNMLAGHLNELSSVLNDVASGRDAALAREYRGAFQGVQSAVHAVARGYKRMSDDLERLKAEKAAVRTAPAPAARFNAGTTPTAARTTPTLNPPTNTPTARSTPTSNPPTARTSFGAASPTPARTLFGAPKPPAPAGAVVGTVTPRPAAAKTNTQAPVLPVAVGKVVIPSGAHEYNRKDFGKYK
jgi:uncharacterized protein YukE